MHEFMQFFTLFHSEDDLQKPEEILEVAKSSS